MTVKWPQTRGAPNGLRLNYMGDAYVPKWISERGDWVELSVATKNNNTSTKQTTETIVKRHKRNGAKDVPSARSSEII